MEKEEKEKIIMPIIHSSNYQPYFLYKNAHINTMGTSLFRRVKSNYKRVRIETPDNDFLDLDFSLVNSKKLLIATHGLEGSSDSSYIKGIISMFNNQGWDAVGLNLRSCSGEPNRLFRSYHSGSSEDLDSVVKYVESKYNYESIYLVGFSLGGNITLKYVGENGSKLSKKIKAAAAVSVPCHLKDAGVVISQSKNPIYIKRFLRTLIAKAIDKKKRHPYQEIDLAAIKNSKNFFDFDNAFTAPANGFKDADDYWKKSSCKQFLPNIKTPTLLINALDDPFLSKTCFPFEEAEANPSFYFEATEKGGHVAFSSNATFSGVFWHEKRILDFFTNHE